MKMKNKLDIKKVPNKILNKFGFQLVRLNRDELTDDKNSVFINIGSGNWSKKGWINLDHPSDYYKNTQRGHTIIAYDIRKDYLPFADDSVDAIYCSHVIEHIENKYIFNMFKECLRILKKGKVFRIACPDAEFLYQISQRKTDYWKWRWDITFSNKKYYNGHPPREIDYLVQEIASPKLLGYVHGLNDNKDYIDAFQSMDMNTFFDYLTSDLQFREEYPGDHINWWTFDKLSKILYELGFDFVIRSKYNGSCCLAMTSTAKFDTTHPQMSLYVEAIK
jgi:predicted SAM-dependent methyltransferase